MSKGWWLSRLYQRRSIEDLKARAAGQQRPSWGRGQQRMGRYWATCGQMEYCHMWSARTLGERPETRQREVGVLMLWLEHSGHSRCCVWWAGRGTKKTGGVQTQGGGELPELHQRELSSFCSSLSHPIVSYLHKVHNCPKHAFCVKR